MNARIATPDIVDDVDWSAVLRLGFVASLLAGFAAMAMANTFSEQTIVLLVIVAATMASWFQLDRPATIKVRR